MQEDTHADATSEAPILPEPAAEVSGQATDLPQMLPDAELEIPSWAGQRDDEPFDVTQFLQSRMPPADNAAPLYLAALADISTEMGFVYSPAQWKTRLPQVEALEESIGELSDADKLLAGAVSLEEIEQVLDVAQPALRKLGEAQDKPQCVFVTGMQIHSLLPHAQAARQVARLAVLQLYHACETGDFDQADQAIRGSLRLSRDLRPRGNGIVQLVSTAMDVIVLDAIEKFTLRGSGLNAEQCDRLLGLLAEHQRDAIESTGEGIRMEYIVHRNTLLLAQEWVPGELDKFAQVMGIRAPGGGVNWEAMLTTSNRWFAIALEQSEQPYHEVLQRRLQEDEDSRDDLLGGEGVELLRDWLPPLEAVEQATARYRAHLAGVRALVAVRRYELVQGKPPESLQVATREAGLSETPLDPYSGQPLLYRVIDGKPVVYSVGSDQKDDGGAVDWQYGQQPGDFLFRIGD